MNIWADKVFRILDEAPEPDFIALIRLYLVDYLLWTGNMEKADLVAEETAKAIHNRSHSPMTLIAVRLTEALNHWYHGRLPSCIYAVSEGLKIAEAKGVAVFNYFLFGHGAVASITGGDIKTAEKYIKQMASVLDTGKRLCASYYHHVAACLRLLKKDLSGALEHEEQSSELAVKLGSYFAEGMSGTGLALIHYELGDRKKAASEVFRAKVLAIQTGSALVEFVSYIFEAYFDFDSGDRKRAAEKLKAAFLLGRKRGLVNFHMWRPDIMARLCLLALDEGIETDYARTLILERDLFPEEPPLQVENWPWRLKIYGFGRFHIVKDGVSLEFTKKAPRKTLDPLKLLIALGGKEVPEGKILDMLWHDTDGDAAHAAFKTSLNRLRNLLGFEEAIVLRNGRLTLNTRYCWVDVMAFERLINRAEARTPAPEGGLIDLLTGSIELYRSGLNIDFEDSKWSLMFNERIKSMFIRTVIKLGSHLEKADRNEEAIERYRKGIENEPLSEKLYQNLMICLDKNGQKGEALALYKRMVKVFNEVFGIEPSAKTKQIYAGIAEG